MHVLIIPSEEFVPRHNHAIGIFQYHQAAVLQNAGYKVGALSITQEYSALMLFKALAYKLLNKKTGNKTDEQSFMKVLGLLNKKLFTPQVFIEEDRVGDINVIRIEGFYYVPPSDYTNIYGWVRAGLLAFKKYIDKYGMPDVVHAHNAMYAGILAKAIKQQYKVPYIITEHSTLYARGMINDNRLKEELCKAYLSAKGVYAVSIPFCKLLGDTFGGVKFDYLPNVLDPYFESASYEGSEIADKKEFIFLNIAELHPKKNHKLLIDAFALLKKDAKYSSAKLWVAGKGTEYDNLKELIKSYGLESDIILLGLLNREDIRNTIKKSDAIVLSSDFETFGVVLIEGMLFGKPVISTSCGGPESFVTDANGIVVEKQDTQALSIAMQQMIDRYGSYKAEEIRNYVIAEFGADRLVERLNAAYKAA